MLKTKSKKLANWIKSKDMNVETLNKILRMMYNEGKNKAEEEKVSQKVKY